MRHFFGHGRMSMLRLLIMTFAGLITAAVLVSTSFGAEPAIKVDDTTAEATSSAGATVTIHVKAFDPETNNAINAACSPGGSGFGDFNVVASYPVGDTTVVCTGTLENGDPAESETITVKVQDTTPPSFGSVSDITEPTTDPAGKQVTYTSPTATDLVDGSVAASCLPASGNTFPIGTTQVSCTATDTHGNPATANFNVTVTFSDSESPTFTPNPPPSINVNTSGTNAVVTFSVAASDNSGNAPVVNCNPPSGSTFPVGTTTVTCTASDGVTPPATASFSVTVTFVDTVGPVLSGLSPNLTVEANGPAGSIVNYPSPAANDAAEGPSLVTCFPSSGSMFALGATSVTCSASDSHGNTSTASFTISVVDRIAPSLVVPRDRPVYADTPDGINRQSHYVALFLSQARAGDTVDPNPTVWNNAPEFLTVGTHTVTFFASDSSGNTVAKSVVLEVLPMPPPGTPPLPDPPAPVAPANVRALKAEAGDRRVRLTWQMPNGVDHVVVTRTLTAGGDPQVIYTGPAEVFTDRGVVNDLEYRYLVVSVNKEGETSAGVAVVALPKRTLLKAPKDGARLKKAPKLVWLKNAEASYYNVQLFRGTAKILSAWPLRPSLLVKKSWKYQGRAYKLSPGLYRWYVWPGFGKRSAVDYGGMLGFSTFRIIR